MKVFILFSLSLLLGPNFRKEIKMKNDMTTVALLTDATVVMTIGLFAHAFGEKETKKFCRAMKGRFRAQGFPEEIVDEFLTDLAEMIAAAREADK